jgi:hypothetical protein
MIFRVVTDTQAFNEILVTLQQIGVPSMLFITALPFLIGFVAAARALIIWNKLSPEMKQ